MCVPTHEFLKYDIVKMATAMSAETLENWTFDLAYTREPKLFIARNQRKPQTNVVFFKDLWVETQANYLELHANYLFPFIMTLHTHVFIFPFIRPSL
jgi:hypothetical protein